MRKLVLLISALFMASVFVFAGDEAGTTQSPRTMKECLKQCKDDSRGCIGAAENKKTQIRECKKTEISCRRSCQKECLKQCKDRNDGCMNTAEADKARVSNCKKQDGDCNRRCR